LDISSLEPKLALVGNVSVLEDRSAALTATQAVDQSGWKQAMPKLIYPVGNDSAFWIRVAVTNISSKTVTRWLVLDNPHLESVDFFRFDPDDAQLGESLVNSSSRLQVKPLVQGGKEPIFALSLKPSERALLLLRVEGRTGLVIKPMLWEPLAFREQEAWDDLLQLVPITAVLTAVLCLLAESLARRNLTLFLLAGWLLAGSTYDLVYQGYLRHFFLVETGDLKTRALQILAVLASMMSALFMYVYLEIGKRSVWRYGYQAVISVLAVLLMFAFIDDLRDSIAWLIVTISLLHFVWPLSLRQPWRKTMLNAKTFLIIVVGIFLLDLGRIAMFVSASAEIGQEFLYAVLMCKLYIAFTVLFDVFRRSTLNAPDAMATQATLLDAKQSRFKEIVRLRSLSLQQAAIASKEATRAKTALLARISHDLRAPLTPIIGFSDIIIQRNGPSRSHALNIESSSRKVLVLINGLIEHARCSPHPDLLQLPLVSISDFLQSITTHAVGVARKNHNHFDYRIVGELPDLVEMNAKALRQVLKNLLANAAEFTYRGEIELLVTTLPTIGDLENGPLSFVFTVRDTGPGIPTYQPPELYEPIHQLGSTQDYENMAVDLAMAHQWVQSMGGTIEALSELDGGTTMRVVVPLKPSRKMVTLDRQLVHTKCKLSELKSSDRIMPIRVGIDICADS
jgi:signal transduction histidine kinase